MRRWIEFAFWSESELKHINIAGQVFPTDMRMKEDTIIDHYKHDDDYFVPIHADCARFLYGSDLLHINYKTHYYSI